MLCAKEVGDFMGVFQYIQLFFNKVPHDFSEDWYLEFNPDVAEAVKKGAVSSGREHYLHPEKMKEGYIKNQS